MQHIFGPRASPLTKGTTVDEVLNLTLRTAVHDRLDYLDTLVDKADELSKSRLADTVITQLTSAWRELLAAHEPDERGRCPACSAPRLFGRSRCTVWRTAHSCLIADTTGRSRGGRDHFRRRDQTS